MALPHEIKKLKGTLENSRVKKSPMSGTIAMLNDVDEGAFVNTYAYDEYRRCFVELSEGGVIQTTDISSLIMLCDMWGVYCDMKDSIRGGKYNLEGCYTSSNLTNFFRSYAEYFKLCKEFGLTPVARTKIETTPKDVGDDFDNL